MRNTVYKVDFIVSLYPEDREDVINDDVFKKYLCNEYESDFVISHLYTVNKNSLNIDTISNIEYTTNGCFTCKITNESIELDQNYNFVKKNLWPYQIDKYLIYIDEEFYNIDLRIKNVELQNSKLQTNPNICEFCDENDVEHTCTDCDTKICYPCRDRCSTCMETLCPDCYSDDGLCGSCLNEEQEQEDDNSDDDSDDDNEDNEEILKQEESLEQMREKTKQIMLEETIKQEKLKLEIELLKKKLN